MNMPSESRVNNEYGTEHRAAQIAEPAQPQKILVWDAPVRVFHWLMVFSFAGAYLTAESERWRLLHVTLGYTMAGLVVFRIVWGLVGTRYARFSDFVHGPQAIKRYIAGLLRRRPEHHAGHNPAGAMAILALLLLSLMTAAFGWATYHDLGGDWLEEVHEAAANLMLAVVGIHIAGVAISSWLHRDNLIGAMISGKKLGAPEQGIRRAWHTVAVLMIAIVLGFWWRQWQSAPGGGESGVQAVAQASSKAHHHDDDD